MNRFWLEKIADTLGVPVYAQHGRIENSFKTMTHVTSTKPIELKFRPEVRSSLIEENGCAVFAKLKRKLWAFVMYDAKGAETFIGLVDIEKLPKTVNPRDAFAKCKTIHKAARVLRDGALRAWSRADSVQPGDAAVWVAVEVDIVFGAQREIAK